MSNPLSMQYLDMLIPQEPQAQDSWTWATVTAIGPLKIRLDGETTALAGTPEILMKGLAVGDRVWVQLYGRRAIIHGASSRTGAGSIFGGDTGWHYLDAPGEPTLQCARYMDMSGAWNPGRFRRDAAGQVWMGGLVTLPNNNGNQLIFTLPVGYRPAYRVVIQTIGGTGQALIEVMPSGTVKYLTGGADGGGYVSLEPVQFMADGSDPLMQASWVPLVLKNGWTLYDNTGTYGPAAYLVDAFGDVHFRSHIKGGTTSSEICNPLPFRIPRDMLWCIPAVNGMVRTDINRAGQFLASGYSPSASNGWICLDTMILPQAAWNGLLPIKPTLGNSWVQFDPPETNWSNLRFAPRQDGVCNMWGMVASGASGAIVVAGGLTPAYRSDHQEIHVASCALAGGARIDLMLDGSVGTQGYICGGTNQWMGLHARWWRAGY